MGLFLGLSTTLNKQAVAQEMTFDQLDQELKPRQLPSIEVVTPNYSIQHLTLANGTPILGHIINGPPNPPVELTLERAASIQSITDAILLQNFPSYDWVFGCSAVSGAMIAGYYDRMNYPNMYTGPTNGGVMPLTDTAWPRWSDGYVTYPNNPLIASKNGVDGRTVLGSLDDYWVKYNSFNLDPYIYFGWPEHTWGAAIGDFMKTSQSTYSNYDGSTIFYGYNTAEKLTCATMLSGGVADVDGTYGRKLFYESRGYTVTDCYNQPTDNNYAGGFSLANFQAEINAGHPVLLNLEGHSIVGYGYNGSTIYIRDTWDNDPGNTYTMTWGGSYQTMRLLSVSVVHLQASAPPPAAYQVFLPSIFAFPSSNGNPTDLSLSNNSIAENQAVNTLVGTFSTVDPDSGDSFTYSLVSGNGDVNNASFNISGDQLRSSAIFDFETKNSYSIRVRTTDRGGLTFEKSFTISVTISDEVTSVSNGNFEQGQVIWSEFSSNNFDIITQESEATLNAHDGAWFSWLGGWYDEDSSISQSVSVPVETSYLHYWYLINSEDTCGNAYFWIKVNNSPVMTRQLCTTQNTDTWVQGVVDLSAYIGTTVTLKFEVSTDNDLISNLFLDDVFFSNSVLTVFPSDIGKEEESSIWKK